MRNKITILLIALVVLVFAVSCSSTGKSYAEVEVTASGNVASGENFTAIAYGNSLRVELDANATTGYAWAADISDSALATKTLEDYKTDSASSGLVGAGGTACFEFQALAPGKLEISFGYARSWEGKPVNMVKLFLVVDEGLNFRITDFEEN